MNRALFISCILCLCLGACSPSAVTPVATETRVPTPAGDYLWIHLRYSFGMLGTLLELTVSYYDPATHPTPRPEAAYFWPDPNPPHVRFRSEARQVIADIPLRMIWFQNYVVIDGPLDGEWEAFVPRLPEFDCLELLSSYGMTLTKVEITPDLHLC